MVPSGLFPRHFIDSEEWSLSCLVFVRSAAEAADSIAQKQLRARALTVHIWLAHLVGADKNTPPIGSYALAECEMRA